MLEVDDDDDGESWKREKALPVRALFVRHLLPLNYCKECVGCEQTFRDGQPIIILPATATAQTLGWHAIECLPCYRRRVGK